MPSLDLPQHCLQVVRRRIPAFAGVLLPVGDWIYELDNRNLTSPAPPRQRPYPSPDTRPGLGAASRPRAFPLARESPLAKHLGTTSDERHRNSDSTILASKFLVFHLL